MATWNTTVWNAPSASQPAGSIQIWQLLRSSFRCIDQLRPGFGYAPSELIDALFILNAMLDSWAADDINAFCTLIQSFPLQSGVGSYTIGPGGVFNGSRPTNISKATLVVLTNPVQPLRLDLRLLNAQEWQDINLQLTQSTLTQQCWYNPTNPLGTLNFWPVPTEADNVEISSAMELGGGFTADTQYFIAPPGYLDAVRYNLAIRLAMEWGKPLKPGVVDLASEALAKVQRRNMDTPEMQLDAAIFPVRSGRSGFNRLTGDFGT